MLNSGIPDNTFIYVCSRNPIAIWAISNLFTQHSSHLRVVRFFASPLPIASKGVHILLFDAACIPEWPELVSKWTSAGYKAILLVAEGWGSGGAAHRALHLGVSGIVHVAIEFHTQIVDAIALVASGQLCVKDTVNDRQATSRRKNCSSSEPHISFREEQVIDLVILGFSNTKIGIQLGISESTAKFHVCNVLHKLGLKRRGELRGRTVCAFDMYKERLAAQIKDQRIIKGT